MKRLFVSCVAARAEEAVRVDREARRLGWKVIIENVPEKPSLAWRGRTRAAITGAGQCAFVCSFLEMQNSHEMQYQLGIATGAGVPTGWYLPPEDRSLAVERKFDLVDVEYVDLRTVNRPIFRELPPVQDKEQTRLAQGQQVALLRQAAAFMRQHAEPEWEDGQQVEGLLPALAREPR